MVLVTDDTLAQGISQAGSALGSSLQNILAQKRQQQVGTTLSSLLEQIQQEEGELTPENFASFLSQAIGTGASPQQMQTFTQGITPLIKAKQTAKKENTEKYEQGLQILSRQKDLLKSGSLGPIIGFGQRKAGATLSKKGREDRAEYEQLGKSLIALSTTIPIRNRLEFETLSNKLMDPTMSQQEIKGTLNALEKIFEGHLPKGKQGAQREPQTQQFEPPVRAVNPKTGEELQLVGGKWQKIGQ